MFSLAPCFLLTCLLSLDPALACQYFGGFRSESSPAGLRSSISADPRRLCVQAVWEWSIVEENCGMLDFLWKTRGWQRDVQHPLLAMQRIKQLILFISNFFSTNYLKINLIFVLMFLFWIIFFALMFYKVCILILLIFIYFVLKCWICLWPEVRVVFEASCFSSLVTEKSCSLKISEFLKTKINYSTYIHLFHF